jgi:hypothetical protein
VNGEIEAPILIIEINSDLERVLKHKVVLNTPFVAYLTRFPSLRSKWYFEHKKR